MAQYRFAITQAGETTTNDPIDLADNEAAWEEATVAMGQLLKDADGKLREGGDMKMVVSEGERPIFTLRVSSVVHTGAAFP